MNKLPVASLHLPRFTSMYMIPLSVRGGTYTEKIW